MHILRARARRESRARSDAPSATSRGELASIARRCLSTNNFYLKCDPFFSQRHIFKKRKKYMWSFSESKYDIEDNFF